MFDTSNPTVKEGMSRRKLAYLNEFRDLLKMRPGIVRRTIQLADLAVARYDPPDIPIPDSDGNAFRWDKTLQAWTELRTGERSDIGRGVFLSPSEPLNDETYGLTVTVLGISRRVMCVRNVPYLERGVFRQEMTTRHDDSDYLKVSLGSEAFFVKRSTRTIMTGFREFQNALLARELLADLNYARVVTPLLGLGSTTQSWFVSEWEDLKSQGYCSWMNLLSQSFDEYGRSILDAWPDDAQEEVRLKARFATIRDRLKPGDFCDLEFNLQCNPQTGQFFYLDPTRSPECTDPNYDLFIAEQVNSPFVTEIH